MNLGTNPPRGTADRYPEEFRFRNYIFATWRKVCKRYGYEEYLGPLVEHADIWRAKSGEDVGGTELTLITTREGEVSELALRPEMTPTVTRMVAKKYNELAKPVRRYSIANFYRNERPQRGRNREFWQLNVDMFGDTSSASDLEILQMGLDIMLAFTPPKNSFVMYINHRVLIDGFLRDIVGLSEEKKQEVTRWMDKYDKVSLEKFELGLESYGLNTEQSNDIIQFIQSKTLHALIEQYPLLKDNIGVQEIQPLITSLESLGYGEYIQFNASLMRGFDYYDGVVFEVFDLHPENNRALFGGGRYNGLASIFGIKENIPAIGFAPGDEPMRLFLESRGMKDALLEKTREEKRYIPLLDIKFSGYIGKIAKKLREDGKYVECGLSPKKFGKAIKYADKQHISYIVICGEDEVKKGVYKVKNLKTGEEYTKQAHYLAMESGTEHIIG